MGKIIPKLGRFTRIFCISAILNNLVIAEEESVKIYPVSFKGGFEIGQLINGQQWGVENDVGKVHRMSVIPRLGISMTQHALIENKLDIQVGVGGLFFYNFPELDFWWVVGTKFGPGISKAQAIYYMGDLNLKKTYLQLGFFPLKYNQDAQNLGEYLFRSRPYPGILQTGGWMNVNNSAYGSLGARFHFEKLNGKLKNDFLLLLEKDFWPNYNLSPGYLFSLKLGNFELGGGISLHHYIPVKPSLLSPNNKSNHYIEIANFPATFPIIDSEGDTLRPGFTGGAIGESEQVLSAYEYNVIDSNGDSKKLKPAEEKIWYDTMPVYFGGALLQLNEVDIDKSEKMWLDTINRVFLLEENVPTNAFGSPRTDTIWQKSERNRYVDLGYRYPRTKDEYFSHQGIKLMMRMSYDLTSHFETPAKIFFESVLLGVKNYSFFYDNILQRVPVMIGVQLPTYGLLDVLSIQLEYYNSPNRNSLANIFTQRSATPFRDKFDDEIISRDNFHWSIFSRKKLGSGVNLFLQIASDHLRLIEWRGVLNFDPVTSKSNQWYYMTKLEFGI